MKKWLLPFAALFSTAAFGTNIVQNPGFETGSFSGWTASNWFVSSAVDGIGPNSGNFFAGTGCVGAACLTTPTAFTFQTLATTSGDTYEVSFWYDLGVTTCTVCNPQSNDPSGTLSELQVLWGGTNILTAIQSTALPDQGWVLFTATVLANSNTTQLEFIGQQDPAGLGIDDVCVDVAGGACGGIAPEPGALLLSATGIVALGLLGLRRQALRRQTIPR